jgi:ADP-ribose pyrophosphatase YjhB (NUDIX family)
MDRERYQNTPTVVVVLVPIRGGLLMIRRALPGQDQGKLALPGGYQMLGQTWQEAGAAEVLEETGVVTNPTLLRVLTVETTPDRRQNLLFCQSPSVEHNGMFVHDAEVSEVLVIHEPVETAFMLHTRQVQALFARQSPSADCVQEPRRGSP